jgi:two-component system chemotaxis response regulator CheY/two-component system response regulator (stage 0 sporulation protein A)
VIGTGRNGRDAVKLFQELAPDITLLDVAMPDTDGIYALDQIRQISPNSAVIMTTAGLSQDAANQLEKLKATAVVYKPFDIDVLAKIIENIESTANSSQIKIFH